MHRQDPSLAWPIEPRRIIYMSNPIFPIYLENKKIRLIVMVIGLIVVTGLLNQ